MTNILIWLDDFQLFGILGIQQRYSPNTVMLDMSKFQRIKIENVDGATEEVDLLKKQEIEKQKLMENDANMENEVEQVL